MGGTRGLMTEKTTSRRRLGVGVSATGWLAAALLFSGAATPPAALAKNFAQNTVQKRAEVPQGTDSVAAPGKRLVPAAAGVAVSAPDPRATKGKAETPAPKSGTEKTAAVEGADNLPERADPKIAKLFEPAAASQTVTLDNSAYADILSKVIEERPEELTLVRYGAATDADKEALKKQIAGWEAVDPTKLTRDQKFVYFVNLYNAVTLDVVLDHYPVKTIRDIKIEKPAQGLFASLSGAFTIGPWSDKLVKVNGTELSLDDIEHSILRPMGDNRVHYAINCASVGCPNLKAAPWTTDTLDEDLNAAATAYIGSKRGMQTSAATDGLLLSKIYSWFQVDFGGSEAGVIDHLRKYAPAKDKDLLKHTPRITGYRYDWSLNDARTLG